MLDKKSRLLTIFYRMVSGETLYIRELAEEYGVSCKTITRDITMIESFLAENRALVCYAQLSRSSDRGFRLDYVQRFRAEELLAVIKILFGSRVLNKKSLNGLIKKLINSAGEKEKERFKDICKKEMEFYRPAGTRSSEKLIERVWELERLLRSGKEISITYKRIDEKTIERTLYPIAVIYSDCYFYLLACRADKENSAMIYYRVDRIQTVNSSDRQVPFNIMDRQKKEAARLYTQNMFMGEQTRIRFLYTGPSVEAILDRFPTAKILWQDENGAELSAMVEYGRGTLMKLMEQGKWVKVLSPERVVKDMREEMGVIWGMYEKDLENKQ